MPLSDTRRMYLLVLNKIRQSSFYPPLFLRNLHHDAFGRDGNISYPSFGFNTPLQKEEEDPVTVHKYYAPTRRP
jgi:hypothetical protein